jgi:hypothetical protein
MITQPFPTCGLVREAQILAPGGPLPIGRSTWWAGVKSGRYPKPVKLGARITAWHAAEIIKLVEEGITKFTDSGGISNVHKASPEAEVSQHKVGGRTVGREPPNRHPLGKCG